MRHLGPSTRWWSKHTVLLELKDARMLTRLVEQVDGYAKLVDEHAELFAELFGALLGEPVMFDGPTERWIVWPAAGAGTDPREAELRKRGVRAVGYTVASASHLFAVGPGAARIEARCDVSEATMRITSTDDPRLADLVHLGAGEGFATYSGRFEGKPALIVDSGTLADFMDDDDDVTENVGVTVSATVSARDRHIEELRRRQASSFGRIRTER